MDNLKYYNDSLAYDFEMFMPKTVKPAEKKDNIVKLPLPKTKARKKAAVKSVSAPAFLVAVSFFILAALCGNIAIRLEINEINSEISDVKAAIGELDSEKTSLEMEFERRITFSNIEQEAQNLGMKKMDKNQVTYIRVNNKNSAMTKDGKIVSEE